MKLIIFGMTLGFATCFIFVVLPLMFNDGPEYTDFQYERLRDYALELEKIIVSYKLHTGKYEYNQLESHEKTIVDHVWANYNREAKNNE